MRKIITLLMFGILALGFTTNADAQSDWNKDKYEREKEKNKEKYEREKERNKENYEREKERNKKNYEREKEKNKAKREREKEYYKEHGNNDVNYQEWYQRWKQLPADKQKAEIQKLSPQQRQKLKQWLAKNGKSIDDIKKTTTIKRTTPVEKWRQLPSGEREQIYSKLPNDMKAQIDSWMNMSLADKKASWQALPESEKNRWRKVFAKF